ncbi:Plipastatin synthase subunit B [Rickettsia tamurae subsp. buchneri]|uniref:Plipastatin synthase subunit B n=1 Tax=Rickettsia tamurae subsp. buchneri TaxID=1462938 RepID=A0A8E0WN54_9RICK|nr:Plipastatin synthase subunit B [Rickettsia tamurae subsp. buchneri]
MVIDGLAIDALLKQISHLYNLGVINIEQPRFVQEGNFSRAVEFWYNKFVNKIQLCNWPSNNVSDRNSYQSVSSLSNLQVNELQSIVNKLNITLPSLLLSIFSITLYRLGLGDDLIIGCPVANRMRLEQRDFVCNLTNTLLIRTIIDRDINLTVFLIRNYQELLEMLNYQDISIDKIITELSTQIDLPSSMFEMLFSFMDFGHSLELKDIIAKRKFNFPRNSKASLVLSVVTNACGSIELIFESIGNKVDHDFLNTIRDIYKNLILTLNNNLDYAIDNIDILPEAHKEIIRKKAIYNKTKANMHLAEWFINTSYKYKSNVAIIDGEIQISYQELLHEARQIAIAILDQTAGVKQGIGLSMDRSWKIVSSILGILLAGCYYVPLDPRNPEVRTKHIIEDSGINLIIDDTNYLSYSCPNTSNISKIKEVNYNIDDIAYIIYTSGTTGIPKGVPISHRNISSLFLSCQEWANFSSQDVWSLFHSYAFDFSVWEIFGAMLYGSKLIIISIADSINSKNFVEIVNKHRITIINQTPTAFKNLLSANVDLIHIPRLIIFGGEALYSKELEPWFTKYRPTNTLLVNMYGITEVTIHATWKVITDDTTALYSNIGIPITDTGIVIVNDKGMICPINIPGEIWVSGERICKGYLNLPKTNKQQFVNKNFPKIIRDRFYKSGDCAKLNNNGEFEFLGRIDQQLKINGHRIESAEIITALKGYQSIIDACLQVIRSEQNIQILVAYYLGDKNIISHQLSNFLSNILPYYAIPTYYIHLDAFPMTINGKIDYACLPAISTSCHVMDFNNANNIEDKVKSIWTKLLNLTHLDDQYGFFEAGGNSIKALLLAQELNQTFEHCGICMSIVDIFRYPSIKAQIEFIRNIISKEVV